MIERSDAVNWSTLRTIRISPLHYLDALAHPREDTEALLLGRLTHCMVYEPTLVAERYVREPRFNRAMKDETARAHGLDGGRESAALWALEHVHHDVVPVDLWSRAEAMAASLHADPIAAPMITGGYAEQSITWVDASTGIDCRGRIDHVNGCLSDLKTTRTIEPRLFAATAARYGYHAQLAWYLDGLVACGVAVDPTPSLIVVENERPHDVLVLDLDDATLAAGRAVYRGCLERLAECRERDAWPGVGGGSRSTLALPAWAVPVPDEQVTLGGESIYGD